MMWLSSAGHSSRWNSSRRVAPSFFVLRFRRELALAGFRPSTELIPIYLRNIPRSTVTPMGHYRRSSYNFYRPQWKGTYRPTRRESSERALNAKQQTTVDDDILLILYRMIDIRIPGIV